MSSRAPSTYDYVIVGAGSAGCVLASRLSEDPAVQVLLLESGPPPDSFWIGTPAGVAKLFFHPAYNWRYLTEPVPALGGRQVHWPRGRTLGGSSAINGMVYMRGHPLDYDEWERLGNPGWGWRDVLPYFKRSEANERGANDDHNDAGPWKVSDPLLRHPSSDAFIEAAARTGIAHVSDLNAAPHEGVGYQQFNIRNGRRHSAYDAFVSPVRHRRNLVVSTRTTALRILMNGRQATGVEAVQAGQVRQFIATREVILAGGVVNSPQLLMLSGVGPGEALQRLGIPVVRDCPGVGQNLQDHWNAALSVQVTHEASYNHELRGVRKYLHGVHYLSRRKGYLSLGSSPLAAYVKSDPLLTQPDLQLVSRAMTFAFDDQGQIQVDRHPAISAVAVLLDPRSRGHLELKSPDPLQAPLLHPNYLSHPDDGRRLVEGLRRLRTILRTEPLASRVVAETTPGTDVCSDEDLLAYVRSHGGTSWHPVGTCKMGSDPMAVVDASLRVHGIDRLRVVDASIMPTIVSGNTSAPAVMIGEKAADMIRAGAAARTP